MREAIAKTVAGTIVTGIVLPLLLEMINVDRWLIVCIALFATVAVLVWGLPAHPEMRWRQKMWPIITMIVGGLIFGSGALWYYAAHPKVAAPSPKNTGNTDKGDAAVAAAEPDRPPAPIRAPPKPKPAAEVFVKELLSLPTQDNVGRGVVLVVKNKGPGIAYSGSVQSRFRPSATAMEDSEVAEHETAVIDRARVPIAKRLTITGDEEATYVITDKPIVEDVWRAVERGDYRLYVFVAYPFRDSATRPGSIKATIYTGFYSSNFNGGVMFSTLKNITSTYTIRPAAKR